MCLPESLAAIRGQGSEEWWAACASMCVFGQLRIFSVVILLTNGQLVIARGAHSPFDHRGNAGCLPTLQPPGYSRLEPISIGRSLRIIRVR